MCPRNILQTLWYIHGFWICQLSSLSRSRSEEKNNSSEVHIFIIVFFFKKIILILCR